MGTQNARFRRWFVDNLTSYQLIQNNMDVYLIGSRLLSDSPYNLFTWDLYLGQFDQAGFVIIPKLGQLVVHSKPPIKVPNNTTTFNSITKTHCPMIPSMLVSRRR